MCSSQNPVPQAHLQYILFTHHLICLSISEITHVQSLRLFQVLPEKALSKFTLTLLGSFLVYVVPSAYQYNYAGYNIAVNFTAFCMLYCLFLLYLLIFRGTGREGERGEKHQCVVASHVPLTGDLACNSGMCPDWELNRQPTHWFTGLCSIH